MNVIETVSNLAWDSSEYLVLDFARALRDDNHDVYIFCRKVSDAEKIFKDNNFRCKNFSLRGPRAFLSPVRMASFINDLDGPVAIHAHNFKDAHIALNTRRLCRNPEHVRVIMSRHRVKPASISASRNKIYKEIDAIVFDSTRARNVFLQSNPEINPEKLHIVPYGANPTPSENETDNCDETRSVNIIFAGRITSDKGLGTLIDALALIKDYNWHLTVSGTGNSRVVMPIVKTARAKGINHRIDWKGQDFDFTDDLRNAHIAVFPSVGPITLPYEAIAAMGQKCAVVISDSGSQFEYLTDGTDALIVPPADSRRLADALKRLITDTALLHTLAENSLKTYKNSFAFNDFYKHTLEILQKQTH